MANTRAQASHIGIGHAVKIACVASRHGLIEALPRLGATTSIN